MEMKQIIRKINLILLITVLVLSAYTNSAVMGQSNEWPSDSKGMITIPVADQARITDSKGAGAGQVQKKEEWLPDGTPFWRTGSRTDTFWYRTVYEFQLEDREEVLRNAKEVYLELEFAGWANGTAPMDVIAITSSANGLADLQDYDAEGTRIGEISAEWQRQGDRILFDVKKVLSELKAGYASFRIQMKDPLLYTETGTSLLLRKGEGDGRGARLIIIPKSGRADHAAFAGEVKLPSNRLAGMEGMRVEVGVKNARTGKEEAKVEVAVPPGENSAPYRLIVPGESFLNGDGVLLYYKLHKKQAELEVSQGYWSAGQTIREEDSAQHLGYHSRDELDLLLLPDEDLDTVTYYVSSMDGSDNNDGNTVEAPFRTIQKAADMALPGDQIVIREGTYRETVVPAYSGTAERPIVFKAYDGEQVVITGTDTLPDDWTFVRDGIYKTSADLKLKDQNQVFVTGEMVLEARYPNNKGTLINPTLADVDGGSPTSLTDRSLPGGEETYAGASIFTLGDSKMIALTSKVTGFDSEKRTLTFDKLEIGSYAPKGGKDNKYFLYGSLPLLDTAREYVFDERAKELYIWMPDGMEPGNRVEVKTRQDAIDLSGKSYIHVEGIELFGANVRMDEGTHHSQLRSIKASYLSHSWLSTGGWESNKDKGLIIKGHHNALIDSELRYSSASVVRVEGRDNKVINNYIRDGDYAGTARATLEVTGERQLISHNTVENSGRDVVALRGITNSRIAYNRMTGAGWICADLAMLYSARTDGQNTEIDHNLVYGTKGDDNQKGIYLDNQTSNFIVHHNIVYDTQSYGLRLNNPNNQNKIYNNTFHQHGGSGGWGPFSGFGTDMSGDAIINNVFTGPVSYTDGMEFYSNLFMSTDPAFVNAEDRDYALKPESPAVDAGVWIPGITDGYEGSAPDLGALERDGEDWTISAGHRHDGRRVVVDDLAFTPTPYKNELVNGGFETTDLTGWTQTGNEGTRLIREDSWQSFTAKSRTQYYGVRLADGKAGIEQEVRGLTPNTTYRLTGWVKAKNNGTSDLVANLSVRNYGGEDVEVTFTHNYWKKGEFVFTTGPTHTSATVVLEKKGSSKGLPNGSGYVYADDLALTAVHDLRPDDPANPRLTGLKVNGETLPAFNPEIRTYQAPPLPSDSGIPKVEAIASGAIRVAVEEPHTLPGTARIKVWSENSGLHSVYYVHFTRLAEVGKPNVHEYAIVKATASGFNNKETPEMAFDDNLETSWSHSGHSWIEFDLGENQELGGIALAWKEGGFRQYMFSVETGVEVNREDGQTEIQWQRALPMTISNGNTEAYEWYPFLPVNARYVRVYGQGNLHRNGNANNMIREADLFAPVNAE